MKHKGWIGAGFVVGALCVYLVAWTGEEKEARGEMAAVRARGAARDQGKSEAEAESAASAAREAVMRS